MSIAGVTRQAGQLGRVPGLQQRGQLAVGDPVGRPTAAGRCRRPSSAGRRRARPRTARTPGPAAAGSLRRRQRQRRTALADPGAAARLGEDRAALGRVAGARPTSTGRSSGRPPRSAAAASRTGRRAGRSGAWPSRAAGPASASSAATSTSVKSRVPRPAQAERVRSADLALSSSRAGRLVVPQPQPGGGAEEGRGQRVLGEAVQPAAAGLGGGEGLAERGRERARTPRSSVAGSARRPPARRSPATPSTSGCGVLGGPAPRAAARRPRPPRRRAGRVVTAGPGHHAHAPARDRDDGERRGAGHAVGGQRVARPAQVGAWTPRRRSRRSRRRVDSSSARSTISCGSSQARRALTCRPPARC